MTDGEAVRKRRKRAMSSDSSNEPESGLAALVANLIESNGTLCDDRVKFAQSGKAAPAPFQDAFAAISRFSHGTESAKTTVTLYDQDEKNWHRADRVNLMRSLLLTLLTRSCENRQGRSRFVPTRRPDGLSS